MKNKISALKTAQGAFIALLACMAFLRSYGADAGPMLDRWCSAQTNIHTWSADVTQTRSLTILNQPLVSKGKVWVAMPDCFRWEIGTPVQTIALRQTNQLLLIYPRLKRVEKYPLGGAQNGPWKDALALLDASFPKNRSQLESHFRVLSMEETNNVVFLSLQPKSASAQKFITEIQVGFDKNDYLPKSTELRFSDGSKMRNDFSNSHLNTSFADDMFESKVPPDFTVIEPLRQ